MRKLFNAMVLPLFVLAMTAVCVSCGDEDDENSIVPQKKSIVGEWYSDNSSADKTFNGVFYYNSDGTFNYATLIYSPKEGLNEKTTGTSTYTISGNVLKEYGEIGGTFKILNSNEYTLELSDEQLGVVETLYKIIDTYSIERGNVSSYDFSNIGITPVSFTTSDSRIATVAANGEITAVKRGTAYITARFVSGAVVVRVNVTDGDNMTDDFSENLNLSIEDIVNKFGNQYFIPESKEYLAYYMGDWEIESVCFYFNELGKVESIIVLYWTDTDMAAINDSFKKKYELTKSTEDYALYYCSNKYINYQVGCDWKEYYVAYKLELSEFSYFDKFKNMKADEIATEVGYELTDEDDGAFLKAYYGEYFDRITVMYDNDTKEVTMISLRCAEGITQEDVEPWYKENYPVYVEGLGYCEREDWYNMEHPMFINIKLNERNGRVEVMYAKF